MEAAGVSPGLVSAGAGIEGGVPFGETEAVCKARCAILAAEGSVCAGITDYVGGFDGLIRVVAFLGLNLPT